MISLAASTSVALARLAFNNAMLSEVYPSKLMALASIIVCSRSFVKILSAFAKCNCVSPHVAWSDPLPFPPSVTTSLSSFAPLISTSRNFCGSLAFMILRGIWVNDINSSTFSDFIGISAIRWNFRYGNRVFTWT
ncbi:hypothetical protein D3C73_817850 [compost metagenome]